MSTYTFVEKHHKSVFRILSKGRISLVVSGMLLGSTVSFAAPNGGRVSAGNALITSAGNTTTITQSSNRASINWQDFSVRSNETVNFVQPSATAVTLNRVIGTEKSIIDGMLNANGQVFILNSNGILFGKNSSVNAAGLVASTMSMSNDDFMASNYRFSDNGSKESVINEGNINITDGGYAAFLAQSVQNGGIVRASLGKVLLSSGEQMTLKIDGNALVDFTIDKVAVEALIENHGAIYADGGEIYLTTKAVDNLVKGVVNNTGILEAQTLSTHEGKIVLWGETTNIAGTLDASAPNSGNGGFIETSGKRVMIAEGTKVTTKASDGTTGTWLIDPTDFTVAASGGDMSGATLSSNLGSTNVLIQSALGSSGTNGDVNINDRVSWNADTVLTLDAANSIYINADVTATGANAGLEMLYSGGYNLNAPITLSGASATLAINGVNYTLLHTIGDIDNIDVTGLGGHYALGNDIVSTGTYGGALVGNFSGVFTGMGHSISDLTINSTDNYVGLFAYNSGMIRNFGMINGNIQSTGVMVGGLVGKNTGTIQDSFYSGSVYVPGGNGAGGLTAWNNGGIIKDSYSTGTITGNDAVGGLVGYNESSGVIERTYSTATVTSLSAGRIGGIVGANNSGSVSDSYAINQIVGSGSFSGGGVLSLEQMKIAANFSGWDIATAGGSSSKWRIYEGNSAPLLRAFLRSVTVTADDGTRTYDGTTDGFGATAAPDVLLLGTVTTTLGSKNVGTQAVSAAGLYSDQQGYDISYANGTATIEQKTVFIQDVVVSDKTYDGTRNATVSSIDVNGLISGDDVITAAEASFDTKDVGVDKNVRASAINLSGADAGNYWMATEFYDTTATITPKTITSISTAMDKTYDTTTNATTTTTLGGVITGDSVSVSGNGAFTDKNAGTNKTVTVNTIALSGTDAGNYVLNDMTDTTTATINAATLSVNGVSANNKVYDGTTAATLSAINVSGIITGDSVTTTADASFDTKDVGSNKNVRVSGIALSGTDAGNYWMSTEYYDTTANITGVPVVIPPVETPPVVIPPIKSDTDSSAIQNGGMVNVSQFGTGYDDKEGWQNNLGELSRFSEPYSPERSPYTAFADASDTHRILQSVVIPKDEHPVSSNNSIITLVNGGVQLPNGLNQSFYENKEAK